MFIAKNGVVQWAPFLNRTRVFFWREQVSWNYYMGIRFRSTGVVR